MIKMETIGGQLKINHGFVKIMADSGSEREGGGKNGDDGGIYSV